MLTHSLTQSLTHSFTNSPILPFSHSYSNSSPIPPCVSCSPLSSAYRTLLYHLFSADVTHLVSGGKDRIVRVWNSTLQSISSLEIGPSLSLRDGSVASIDIRPSSNSGSELVLLLGTYGMSIKQFKIYSDKTYLLVINDKNGIQSGYSALVLYVNTLIKSRRRNN